jgi:hypothetical protein
MSALNLRKGSPAWIVDVEYKMEDVPCIVCKTGIRKCPTCNGSGITTKEVYAGYAAEGPFSVQIVYATAEGLKFDFRNILDTYPEDKVFMNETQAKQEAERLNNKVE